ncbi:MULTISPECIES: bactofilin family protein, partial [Bacteria]|uniref:bactofilin family protein n=1 Tax=Bacteria TaxID=2 RepID=UPI003632C9FE
MFTQEKKATAELSKEQNKISQGTTITGDIEALGCFRIDGTVEGSVKTPGKVVIGKDGCIKGDLECENADIEGKFFGTLKISGILSLRSTAFIEGEANVVKLAVEPGATFNATCTMRGAMKAINNEKGERGSKQEKSA